MKIKLEVVLCKTREGTKPITVSAGEVALAYGAMAFVLLVAIASIVIFFVGLGNMSHNVADGLSLFSSLGEGHGMGIAALIVWLLSLVTAISLCLRAWNIAKATFLDEQFVTLLGEHLERTKQKGWLGRLVSPYREYRKKYGKQGKKSNAERRAADQGDVDAHLPMLALPSIGV